ncbi:LysE family transporter [Herbaspirillum sp. ST 5-3]|uniref:LysE family translocator n=1 Tax=Oxalobacteraceae TaxID=75682 RepID=UPI0010A31A85|nr:LysE family transporter [Herbaspirillum sp. ST 5-3]
MFSPALVYIMAVISPGPNFILVSRFAAANSIASGIGASFGIWVVGLMFSISSVLGLALLLGQFPQLNRAATILGALYLLYIAYLLIKSALNSKASDSTISTDFDTKETELQLLAKDGVSRFLQSFKMGFLTNITNMKTIAFMISIFSAFLSQSTTTMDKVLIIVICSSFEICWYSSVAFVFGQKRMRQLYFKFNRTIDLCLGLFLIGFAASNVMAR